MRPLVRRLVERLEKQLDERVPEKGEGGWKTATSTELELAAHFHHCAYKAHAERIPPDADRPAPEDVEAALHELVDSIAYRIMIFDNILIGIDDRPGAFK